MNYVKKSFSSFNENEEEPNASNLTDVTTLSFGTRIKWFIICFAAGFVFSLLGSAFLWLPKSGLIIFGVFYTIGNLLSLASTSFLMGPVKQCKKMFAETRWIAAIVMFIFMALTLMSALWWQKKMLCIIFCILQFLALTWYSISYIPFARGTHVLVMGARQRTAIKNCFTTCIS